MPAKHKQILIEMVQELSQNKNIVEKDEMVESSNGANIAQMQLHFNNHSDNYNNAVLGALWDQIIISLLT